MNPSVCERVVGGGGGSLYVSLCLSFRVKQHKDLLGGQTKNQLSFKKQKKRKRNTVVLAYGLIKAPINHEHTHTHTHLSLASRPLRLGYLLLLETVFIRADASEESL